MNLIITMSLAGSIPIVVYYLFGIIGQKKYSAVWERKIIKLSIFFFLCPIQCIKYRLPNDIAHINLLQGQTEKKWYLSKSGFSVVKNVVGDKVLRTDWLIYLKYFWIFLTLSFVVWQIVKYYKLKIKLIQTSKTEEKTAFAEKIVRTYIGKKRKIYFLRNPCIKTPFTIGILNHYIVLPELE